MVATSETSALPIASMRRPSASGHQPPLQRPGQTSAFHLFGQFGVLPPLDCVEERKGKISARPLTPLAPLVIVHAIAFTAWMILFVTKQTGAPGFGHYGARLVALRWGG
jgi:hypothetical protein